MRLRPAARFLGGRGPVLQLFIFLMAATMLQFLIPCGVARPLATRRQEGDS